jgi:Amt family ammonium transporter
MVGLFADPRIMEYLGPAGKAAGGASAAGAFYGHPGQLAIQAGAALTVIVWDGLVTFLLLKLIGVFMPLRMSDDVLEVGDLGVHDEEAYPQEAILERSRRFADEDSEDRTGSSGVRTVSTKGDES